MLTSAFDQTLRKLNVYETGRLFMNYEINSEQSSSADIFILLKAKCNSGMINNLQRTLFIVFILKHFMKLINCEKIVINHRRLRINCFYRRLSDLKPKNLRPTLLC